MECGEEVRHIRLMAGMTVGELFSEFKGAGAYNGGALARACDILQTMYIDKEVLKFFGFAGAMVPAGMRAIVSDMIDKGLIDILVSTGANLTHDIIEALGCHHYHGSSCVSDVDLRKDEINRIYDVFLPNDAFLVFETFMQDLFSSLSDDSPYSILQILNEIGKRLPNGILASASKKNIPVFCPALSDSMIGLQYWLYKQAGKLKIDAFTDMNELLDSCFNAKKAGVFIIGGGVPKNFILQSMLMTPNGFDYAVQLTGDRPDLGGLSGATLDEARSWGKVTPEAKAVTVYADATITLPLLVAAVYERLEK